jgi:hypothetical protein
MATKNDITGDSIQTGVVTDKYRNNYDIIWGKKTPQEIDDAKAEDDAFNQIEKLKFTQPLGGNSNK